MKNNRRENRRIRAERRLDRLNKERENLENRLGTSEAKPKLTDIRPKTEGQRAFFESVRNNNLIICTGPAGSGKTFMAAGIAAKFLRNELVERIICVRPAIEASETPGRSVLGYLPGDKDAKLAPYLRPLLYELSKFYTTSQMKYLRNGEFPTIEICPLEHMRGMTLDNSFVILDEAQNCTYAQLKMFVTRIGEGSTFIINGDLSQSDLRLELQGGLTDLINKVIDTPGVGVVELGKEDIVRSGFLRELMEVVE